MKKMLFLAIISFISSSAHATVGGPTYVHSFTYNPSNESVYFIENSLNGRGCPPVLKKISLNTSEISIVFSCDEGEKLEDYTQASVEIEKRTANFKPLTQINLTDNTIQVDVTFLKNVETEYPEGKEFSIDTYQKNTRLATLSVVGCTLDQPFTFAGYAIPGFNAKIIMVASALGDCFEGGYIYEQPYVVGGIQHIDKNFTPANNKKDSLLIASKATLTVLEKEEKIQNIQSTTSLTTINKELILNPSPITLRMIGIILCALLVGIIVGAFLKKK